ncbi:hypothetical protein [Streptomyces sp. NBC_00344]|uniref:hypothetical protein n=1 Tax=Streptomyces sp. NBC_00344 TaxID=2975720 RepID=UPI002E20D704
MRSALTAGVAAAALAPALVIGAAPGVSAHRAPVHDDCASVSMRQPAGEGCAGDAQAGAQAGRDVCAGGRSGSDFPVVTRIHGGPTSYAPGDGYRTWSIEMKNTTTGACRHIHPVVGIVDRDRTLKNGQIRLAFRDTTAHRWRQVPFTSTDRDEHIGPFGNDFDGFVIPAGRTVSVDVRLAFTPDTAGNDITTNAAIVRRHGDDGDWVGESGGYRFSVTGEPTAVPGATVPGRTRPDETVPDETVPGGTAQAEPTPGGTGAHRTGPGTATPGGTAPGRSLPAATARPDEPLPGWAQAGQTALPPAELAGTGRHSHHHLRLLAGIACACVMLGAALVVGSRRPRIRRSRYTNR